jgi:signal transduction histidine kinase
MAFHRELVNAGVNFGKSPSERRSILLSNIVSLILFGLGALLFLAYYAWYGWSVVTAAIPAIAVLCLSTLFFNHFNYSVISRVFLCLVVPLAALAISIYAKNLYYTSQEELDYFTFRFFLLVSCVFPAIFFSFSEKKLLVVTSLATLLLLMLHDPLHQYFNVPYRGVSPTLKESNYYFTNVVVFVAYLIMVGAVLFLKKVSEDSEARAEKLIQELNTINEELTEKNSEIEAQNQEITAQTENLNISQQKLQSAYKLIYDQKDLLLKQNKSLSSELIEINNDLTSTNNELIKHNNELRQFSYTVSHNLRGPVASLSGLVSLIDARNLEGETADIFEHVKTSLEKLENIIRDLSKIIDIRHDIFHVRQQVDLEREVREIVSGMGKEIRTHSINIETDLQEPVIYSVKPMVHSILYNLITNAVKYRSSQRAPQIVIRSRSEQNLVVLEVEDNGLGIDLNHHRDNLFKLYKRFHYHTEGKGLGLYMVKLQAEALGGYVKVNSQVNAKTTFTVYLAKPDNIQQQVLYEENCAKIYYDGKLNAAGIIWNGPVSSEEYRKVFQQCLELIRVYNTPAYIADLTNQGYINREDQLWMLQNILPQATRFGLRRIAAVHAETNDPKLKEYFQSIRNTLQKLGIDQRFFTATEDAYHWIQSLNHTPQMVQQ